MLAYTVLRENVAFNSLDQETAIQRQSTRNLFKKTIIISYCDLRFYHGQNLRVSFSFENWINLEDYLHLNEKQAHLQVSIDSFKNCLSWPWRFIAPKWEASTFTQASSTITSIRVRSNLELNKSQKYAITTGRRTLIIIKTDEGLWSWEARLNYYWL